jgi:hypothetical protein
LLLYYLFLMNKYSWFLVIPRTRDAVYPERATDPLQRWHQRQEAHVRTEEILQDRDLRTLRKQVGTVQYLT